MKQSLIRLLDMLWPAPEYRPSERVYVKSGFAAGYSGVIQHAARCRRFLFVGEPIYWVVLEDPWDSLVGINERDLGQV